VLAGASHQEADRKILGALHEVPKRSPGIGHLLMSGEQPGVENHDPRDSLGMLGGQPKTDRTAPVVHHDRAVAYVELLEQRRHGLGVPVVAVPGKVYRLVGAAEAGKIRRNAAKPGVARRGDHPAPQERPGRLAMKEDDRCAVALVDVRQPKAVVLTVRRLEREVREAFQQLVGCSHSVGHEQNLSG